MSSVLLGPREEKMPQFYAGEQRIAKVTLGNPKPQAFAYRVLLILGSPEIFRTESSLTIPGGGQGTVNLPVVMPAVGGVHPVFIYLSSGDKGLGVYRATEDVTIVPDLKIGYTNPEVYTGYPAAHFWHVRARVVGNAAAPWVEAQPPNPKQLYETASLSLSSPEFIFITEELDINWVMRQNGPLYAKLPGLGEYIYDAINRRFTRSDGYTVSATNYQGVIKPVQGRFTSLYWDDMGMRGGFIIEAADEMPGLGFIGTGLTVYTGNEAFDQVSRSPVVQLNRSLKCNLKFHRGTPVPGSWVVVATVGTLRYLREYPDSAYVFTGSIVGAPGGVYSYSPPYDVTYSVQGVSPCSVVLSYYYPYYEGEPGAVAVKKTGPGSWTLQLGGPLVIELWAHPDPNRAFNYKTALIDNWQKIAQKNVSWWG
jgi:hypothetical protein